MKVIKKVIQAGRTRMMQVRATTRIKTEKGEKRNPKSMPTREAVQKVNLRNAVWKLCAWLNNNFSGGDYHLVLTFASEPDKQAAKKMLDTFIGNLRKYHKKNGKALKWISATEYQHKRIHHHIVISKTDLEVVRKFWPHGWVNAKMMDESGNYIKLAEYLIKETDKTFREDDSPNKQRYRKSRNLVMPEIREEKISERALKADPEPEKGYYIDKDTVHRYEHAILGVECMQYIMISLETPPRKRRRRGKRSIFEREYRLPEAEQLTMDGLIL